MSICNALYAAPYKRFQVTTIEKLVDVADDGREQETELSLTNRARHLCRNNGVAELVKTRLSRMHCHAEFGRSALQDAGINTGNARKLG